MSALELTLAANARDLRLAYAARRTTQHGFARDEMDERIIALQAEKARLEAALPQ